MTLDASLCKSKTTHTHAHKLAPTASSLARVSHVPVIGACCCGAARRRNVTRVPSFQPGTPQNPGQENAFSEQFVPAMRCLAFDFGVYRSSLASVLGGYAKRFNSQHVGAVS
eukprot:2938127-Rhodomonas_salina.1